MRLLPGVALAFLFLSLPSASATSASVLDVSGEQAVTGRFQGTAYDVSCPALSGSFATATVELDYREADYATPWANVPGTPALPGSDPLVEADRGTASSQWEAGRIALGGAGAGCRLVVLPHAALQVRMEGTHSSLRAATVAQETVRLTEEGRSLPVPGGTVLQVTHDGVVDLVGDVLLAVFDMDASFASRDRTQSLRIGQERTAVTPAGAGGDVFFRVNETEAYVTLRNATLRLGDAAHPFLVKEATITGTDLVADGERVFGALAVQPSGGRVQLAVVQPSLPAPPAGWSSLPLWGFALAATAAAPLAVVALRRRRLLRAFEQQAYAQAWKEAGSRWSLPRLGTRVRLAAAVSALRTGSLDAAAALLRRPWRDRPTWNYLSARLHAQRGDEEAARRHLADCLVETPGFRLEAASDPFLRPLLGRNVLEGYS